MGQETHVDQDLQDCSGLPGKLRDGARGTDMQWIHLAFLLIAIFNV